MHDKRTPKDVCGEATPVRCEKNIQLTVKKRSSLMKTSFKTLINTKITDRLLH